MIENEAANDDLVSADWVRDHRDEFQCDSPGYRLVDAPNETGDGN